MKQIPSSENQTKGQNEQEDYETLPHDLVLKKLETNPASGLSETEAGSRQAKFGLNEVPEKKVSPVIRFASKFWGLTAWMLELTMVFSLILGNYLEFYIIGALIIVNAIIGFAQEEKASSAVETLKKRLHVNARVMREGKWKNIAAREVVPGDIVRVRAGDFVPADLKMVEKTEVSADQSALTGESMTVEKKQDDLLYSGSVIKRGESNGVVVATGSRTFFGKTTELLQSARPRLHMEEIISKVIRWLLVIVGILIALLLVASLVDGANLLEAVSLSLVLVVFAVPVALPAMFTVSMAIGSQELARKGVLVTRLSASEDAATMDILCADKTGTITANKLSVTSLIPANGFGENDLILYGALASQEANQDPIDVAFISAAKQSNLLNQSYSQEQFVPFDPATRRTEALVRSGKTEFRVMKGAVNVIAEACGMVLANSEINEKMNDLALKGYRTLAVATTASGGTLSFCGLVGLYDNPRPDSKALIEELRELGVSVKMLTGDALPIAKEISKQVGLSDSVARAPELRSSAKDLSKAGEIAEKSEGFAEVYPEDKYTIVKALQTKGHTVGMTGDGINDAPALRQAEVGIAVSNATDVAKGSASVVLTDEGLSNIVDLVKIGRMIYQRIVTWTLNKVVKTFEVSVFVVLAFLVTGFYVVSAVDIVLLLFLVDFVTISLSTDTVTWSRKPDRWNVAALVKVGISLGVLTVAELFGLLSLGMRYLGLSGDIRVLHTFVFAALLYMGLFTVLIVRERMHFWDSRPSKPLLVAVVADMMIVGALVSVGIPSVKPLPFTDLLFVFGYIAFFSLGANDFAKRRLMKRFGVTL